MRPLHSLVTVAVLAVHFAAGGWLRADPATTAAAPVESSPDATAARARLKVAPGFNVSLWAGEPLVQNITSLSFDHRGRAYVVETGRRRTSVFDVRNLTPWLDLDFALRTEPERAALLRRLLDPKDKEYPEFFRAVTKGGRSGFQDFNHDGVVDWRDLEVEEERIRRITDADNDGRADRAETFADGFNGITSGVAAGVLAEGTNVWFTCIPDLWKFPADGARAGETGVTTNGPGTGTRVATGFGVHIAFGGHDLHGLIKGPDGRIYFSIADRGACITNREGAVLSNPDSGAVFRCEEDGSYLELFARGLRNPQELAFDAHGNLWTGDNNGDGGDKARWTLLLEGADYGWTMGWQWLPKMGAWNSERLWHTRESNSAAYLVPPVGHVGHGPAGIAYYPGTGLGDRYLDHFFYADFPGGIRTFRVEPDGAFFRIAKPAEGTTGTGWMEDNSPGNLTGKLLWDLSPVDVTFPPFGGVIVGDWVQGWEKTGKGRLWHVTDPALSKDTRIAEVRRLLADGMQKRAAKELVSLLEHADQRVRLEAQWELTRRGYDSFALLADVVTKSTNQLARLHAIWGIGHLARTAPGNDYVPELMSLVPLLEDPDPHVRGHLAQVLGDIRLIAAADPILQRVADPDDAVAARAMLAYARIVGHDSFPSTERPRRSRGTFAERLYGGIHARMPFGIQKHLPVPFRSSSLTITPEPIYLRLSQARQDSPLLRHAASVALGRNFEFLNALPPVIRQAQFNIGITNTSPLVRLATLLAFRQNGADEVAALLDDTDPQIALEAVRAIHDVPIPKAFPQLARLIELAPTTGAAFQPGVFNLPAARVDFAGKPFTRDEWVTWVLRRSVNAAFRLGGDHATHLAKVASHTNVPASVRVEALDALTDWARPPARDRVVGLHRPIDPRSPDPARQGLTEAWPALVEPSTPTNVLVAALRAGLSHRPDGFDAALDRLRHHPTPEVRSEIERIRLQRSPLSTADWIARLDAGPLRNRQEAFAAIGSSREPAAASALESWLKRLGAGTVPAELQLDLLAAAAKSSSDRLRPLLGAWSNSLPSGDALAKFRPVLAGGDAAVGRRLFAERADLGCQRCHKLAGDGGDVGPGLDHLGRTKGRDYILRSILDPNAEIAAGFESVVLELKDGTDLSGILRQETATDLTLQLADGTRTQVRKSEIKSRDRGRSPMPDGLGDLLSPLELRDLIEALTE